MRTKRIDYAYATSVLATQAGFADAGCFAVEIITQRNGKQRSNLVAGFASLDQAKAKAETINLPWDRLTK